MLYFSNNGHLPIRAAVTMGVSVKEGDSPIGMFGTGLKYVIAGVIRLGGRIEIETEGQLYTFGRQEEIIRGSAFDLVTMNGNPLGFTTEYGKHWAPWMYVRELWSNCQDEGGTHGWAPQPGDTHIRIECDALEKEYAKLDDYIIANETPLFNTPHGSVHNPREGSPIFYRSILASKAPLQMMFTYNILERVDLTEDRTIARDYVSTTMICKIICMLKDKDALYAILTAPDHYWEHTYFSPMTYYTDEFKEVVHDIFQNRPQKLNDYMFRWAKHCWGNNEIKTRTLSQFEERKIDKATRVLHALGLTKPVEIHAAAEPDGALYGFATGGKIYLTDKCLDEGVGQIATTLIEEYLHAVEDVDDYSREFQNRTLNLLVKVTEEHVLKEPL